MLKIEYTPIDEKETIILIEEADNTISITTHSARVFNALQKLYGAPHKTYPPVINKGKDMISGASWTFNYKDERDKVRRMLSTKIFLPQI